jgi:RNA-directed DNA polymerase
VDDFLLFGEDKRELVAWREALIKRMADFRLTLHENSAWPRPVREGFPFLGFVLYPAYRRLKRRRGVAFARRLRLLQQDYARHLVSFERLDASIKGWVNHVRYGDTWGLRRCIMCLHGL